MYLLIGSCSKILGEDSLQFISTFQMWEDHLYQLIKLITNDKFFIPKWRDFGFRTFCLGSLYNVYVTFEVFEGGSGNIVSYAIESCFDKD